MPPLSPESDRWAELSHAYGPASDIPELLRRLIESPDDGVWSDLCGSVVHQGDVSEAAYAVLPHVVAAAQATPAKARIMHLAFATTVIAGRIRRPCPSDLQSEFDAAVNVVSDIALSTLSNATLQDPELPYVLSAIAASSKLPVLARILEQFADGEFTFECPACGAWLYVSTEKLPFQVIAEDPVRNPESRSIPIEPPGKPQADSRIPSSGALALPWLCSLSKAQGNKNFAEKLIALYGDGECPKCGNALNLYDELERSELDHVSPDTPTGNP